MKSKYFLLVPLLLFAQAGAAEFRFHHMETTGLVDRVYDASGKRTTVIFTKDSDAEALAVLNALTEKLIFGTEGIEDYKGIKWEQSIILLGDFASPTKRTKNPPNTDTIAYPDPEDYRDFRVTGLKVLFQLTRLEIPRGGDPLDEPSILETHFNFASLFPKGLTFAGKPIALDKYEVKRGNSK